MSKIRLIIGTCFLSLGTLLGSVAMSILTEEQCEKVCRRLAELQLKKAVNERGDIKVAVKNKKFVDSFYE